MLSSAVRLLGAHFSALSGGSAAPLCVSVRHLSAKTTNSHRAAKQGAEKQERRNKFEVATLLQQVVRSDTKFVARARAEGMSRPALESAAQDILDSRQAVRRIAALLHKHQVHGKPLDDPTFRDLLLKELLVDHRRSQEENSLNIDLTLPHEWFPRAREMARDIHLHVGPTNSGKTYSALQALAHAESGWYAGPLRLLAWEVHDSLSNGTRGKVAPCNLLTGQEWVLVDGAAHTSSTVEMADTDARMDVAVIDEIQMIGDEARGWAWTRALLGMQADHIHLCGDPCSTDLIRRICDATGDKLHIHEYSRLSPLVTLPKAINKLTELQQGDCIVAFSKKNLYGLKHNIESQTGNKVSVIYGSLPPETRRTQAEMFNNGTNAILVATDAVGMGLNLQVGRMFFSAVEKFDGYEKRKLNVSEVKQIGGRAGRYQSKFPIGYVGALHQKSINFLSKMLASPTDQLHHAGLQPSFGIVRSVAESQPDLDLYEILGRFERLTVDKQHSLYFMCNLENMIAVAKMLSRLPREALSLADRWAFCCAPVQVDNKEAMKFLRDIVVGYAYEGTCAIDPKVVSTVKKAKLPAKMEDVGQLEECYNLLDLYLWLSNKFDADQFPDVPIVQQCRETCISLIAGGLEKISEISIGSEKVTADRSTRRNRRHRERGKEVDLSFLDDLDFTPRGQKSGQDSSRHESGHPPNQMAAGEEGQMDDSIGHGVGQRGSFLDVTPDFTRLPTHNTRHADTKTHYTEPMHTHTVETETQRPHAEETKTQTTQQPQEASVEEVKEPQPGVVMQKPRPKMGKGARKGGKFGTKESLDNQPSKEEEPTHGFHFF
eukprot:comp22979_c0_seq1/m.36556 comp22979_c0_seq1/g.36556  ORF comp22979_c0_seq1/g.36556 comp22979_c0_seq1/m.36556 type:complete len:829 (-) comp22979_c0_seq1:345-2831(-)